MGSNVKLFEKWWRVLSEFTTFCLIGTLVYIWLSKEICYLPIFVGNTIFPLPESRWKNPRVDFTKEDLKMAIKCSTWGENRSAAVKYVKIRSLIHDGWHCTNCTFTASSKIVSGFISITKLYNFFTSNPCVVPFGFQPKCSQNEAKYSQNSKNAVRMQSIYK